MLMLPFSLNASSFPFPVCLFIDRITSSLQLCFVQQKRTRIFPFLSRQTLKLLIIFTCWPCTCSEFCSCFLNMGRENCTLWSMSSSLLPSARQLVFSVQMEISHLRHSWTCQVSHKWWESDPFPHFSAALVSHTLKYCCLLLPLAVHMHSSATWHFMCTFTADATCNLMWLERWDFSLGFRILHYRIFTFIFILSIIPVWRMLCGLTLAGAIASRAAVLLPFSAEWG